ncbi:MAG: transcriptional regulator [Acidobacteriota bacterium]
MPSATQLYGELWTSLTSLLRSYTAVHGLADNRQAAIEADENRITVRRGSARLDLERQGATVRWTREDGRNGLLELTETGRLRSGEGEEEMDLAAEAWARELMQ